LPDRAVWRQGEEHGWTSQPWHKAKRRASGSLRERIAKQELRDEKRNQERTA